jgi:hypothetical protein
MKKILILLSSLAYTYTYAQTSADSLLNELEASDKKTKENVYTTFKSPRVINSHSVEMLPAGVLDFRILHRFGTVKNGIKDMFGLDYASMRMGFDYGITKHITVGFGRSTFNKEYDFFAKARILQQQSGEKAMPISVVAVAGYTAASGAYSTLSAADRSGYYAQLLIARKFGEHFALQLAPTYLHRNLLLAPNDANDVTALGIGSRVKLSRRVHLVVDAFPTFNGVDQNTFTTPLSVGFDVETGGHVFQLHFSNSRGMNEKAFLTTTTQQWSKGDFSFGFNLSRVFTVKKNKVTNF